jgi:hypothetical protein
MFPPATHNKTVETGKKIHVPYESLRAQTYSNWEWIIWDDSPADHNTTWAELSALRDADPRIQIFRFVCVCVGGGERV